MTKKRKTGLVIGAAVACIAVLCATGACNGAAKEEKVVRRVTVTTLATTSQATEPVSSTTQPTSTVPVTATAESIAVTTAPPQITTAVTCSLLLVALELICKVFFKSWCVTANAGSFPSKPELR